MPSTGLAFSGGGIRSAAFCSGVLRRLLEYDVEVDYLSCVSGGGYTGTAYLDWKYREERRRRKEGGAQRDWHKEFFDHMRDRTGYVCNWKKPFQGILDTLILSCLAIVVAFGQPLIIWGPYTCPVAFIIDLLFGRYLREIVDCDSLAAEALAETLGNTNATFSEVSSTRRHCIARQGTDGIYKVILFAVLFMLFITCYVIVRLNRLSSLQRLFVRLSQYTFGACLALTFIPFSIHSLFDNIPLWAKILFLPLYVIVWLVIPLLRSKISYVLIILFYSYFTHWKVFEQQELAFGIMYSRKLFKQLLFASGFVLWIVPIVAAIHARLAHIYNRWRLQRAFYHREGVGETGCSGIDLPDIFPLWTCLTPAYKEEEETRPLTLADLKDMKPEYLANIVVNRWKKSTASQNSYELLTMSPTEIERIDRDPNIEQFKGRLEPDDLKLSDVMATSAAALSTHMGKYDYSIKGLSRLHTVLQLEMGATMISDVKSVKREGFTMRILLLCLVHVLRGLPLILGPVVYHGSEASVKTGVIIFLIMHLLLVFIALIDTGAEQPSWWEKLARWFIVHISFVYFARELFSKDNIGPMPPPIMLLSDGGHFENLAILPLLKKRLRKIVVVDGGYKQDDQSYGDSLLNALMLARTKLKCSFLSEDGQDVTFDLLETFVGPKGGDKPHYYKFKVRYQSDEFGEEGEGEILLIVPRYPQHGVSDRMNGNVSTNLHPFDVPDHVFFAQDEVNNLTFCCCECCHCQACEPLSKICCNVFPQHNTANQFFTSRMFSAYHCEGYRACVDANAVGFMEDGDRERKDNIGPMPPPIILLSDGGHFENLAILPLLKKRLRKIVVVDGGYKQDDQSYGDSLLNALMLARTKLKCSFLSEDGQDVTFDLLETFVGPKGGDKPHYYKFKVRYQSDAFGEQGEGEILLIAPRDPQHGASDRLDENLSTTLYPFHGTDGVFFSQDEVDELTFCCCECCHCQACEWLSKICCNVFPQHNTANQFFTSRMFSAYHCEGYRACVDANAVGFMKDGDREREHNNCDYINV